MVTLHSRWYALSRCAARMQGEPDKHTFEDREAAYERAESVLVELKSSDSKYQSVRCHQPRDLLPLPW